MPCWTNSAAYLYKFLVIYTAKRSTKQRLPMSYLVEYKMT